ncbi:hypothetical protein BH11VER1_BH11VER1_36400 [soil metagenome]
MPNDYFYRTKLARPRQKDTDCGMTFSKDVALLNRLAHGWDGAAILKAEDSRKERGHPCPHQGLRGSAADLMDGGRGVHAPLILSSRSYLRVVTSRNSVS